MRKYKRISYEDRKKIEKLYKYGDSHQQIADVIGVSRITIYREKKRGWDEDTKSYNADTAQRCLGH